ncbi:hypothetical protein [Streptomyces humi]|uniref:hypothetical protein n=1 Tax=Streptomyces humi TaxID=1428620 RepID=UPI00069B8F68|nr:hypothetical protein [Streptomyces humi]
MSSGPAYGRPRPGSVRLRALVPLLLALLLTGAPTAALAAAAPTAASSAGTAEHDVLDTPLRPAGRAVHRADVPQRPAPLPATGPTDPADRDRRPSCPAAAHPPYATPLPRTVVLRC